MSHDSSDSNHCRHGLLTSKQTGHSYQGYSTVPEHNQSEGGGVQHRPPPSVHQHPSVPQEGTSVPTVVRFLSQLLLCTSFVVCFELDGHCHYEHD